jgi:hypothetical protein
MRLYLLISLFLTQAFVTSAEQAFLSQEYIQVDYEYTSNNYVIDYHNPEYVLIGQSELGVWEHFKYPLNGYLACGISIRLEANQGIRDDTAVNAIEFVYCKLESWYDQIRLRLNDGMFGDWTKTEFCAENWYIFDVDIQIQEDQGTTIDDSSVTGISVRCLQIFGSSMYMITLPYVNLGFWIAEVFDFQHHFFVCGGQVKFQEFQGPGFSGLADDNALTGLKLRFCRVKRLKTNTIY